MARGDGDHLFRVGEDNAVSTWKALYLFDDKAAFFNESSELNLVALLATGDTEQGQHVKVHHCARGIGLGTFTLVNHQVHYNQQRIVRHAPSAGGQYGLAVFVAPVMQDMGQQVNAAINLLKIKR